MPEGPILGWMHGPQLDWLREQASTKYRILELGAWKGMSTRALADATPGKVWVVDNWNSSDPEDEATEALEREGREAVFEEFLANMRPWAGKLVIMRMDSHEAWKRLGHLRFDMVWLDGDHRYEPTREAIRDWRSLLAPGGLLCGHDGEHGGVKQAVTELVPNAKFHSTPQRFPFGPSLIWYSDALE